MDNTRPKDTPTRTGDILYIPVTKISIFVGWRLINKKYFIDIDFLSYPEYIDGVNNG